MARPSPQTDRVIATINLLAATPDGATLTEIARAVGQEPSTCQHMLAALTRSGFLVREPADRRYHLGPALVAPGQAALARYPVLAAARPEMETLARRFELPCFAFAPDEDHARLVHVVAEPGAPVAEVRTGETVPIAPPLGGLFVAWAGDEAIDRWLDRDGTIDAVSKTRYRAVLAALRDTGYAAEVLPATSVGDDTLHLLQDRASPWRDQHLRERLADPTTEIATTGEHIEDGALVTVGAPVRKGAGGVVLTLSLAGTGADIAAAGLDRIGGALRAATRRVARSLPADRNRR